MTQTKRAVTRREAIFLGSTAALVSCAGAQAQAPPSRNACTPTGSDVEGPFFEEGAPSRTVLVDDAEPGERLRVAGRVVDTSCAPLAGVAIEVWHADDNGDYHGGAEDAYRLRARLTTDVNGEFGFDTIKPGRYAMGSGYRPAHIHFKFELSGHQQLTTQLYFEGDPWLPPNDPCVGCNSEDETHVVALDEAENGFACHFEAVLRD